MCGLAGSINWRNTDAAVVAAMTAALRHRGPDSEGLWSQGPAALGFRRLAIIDTSHRADQPMADPTGRYHLIFNGEIYNYRALRATLTQAGHQFRTESDTEVLLTAWVHWGAECLDRLNGMFAFALWDAAEQRLALARDRLGEKPLYYKRIDSHGIAFASELKALRLHPAVSGEIDPRALGQYLSLNYTLGNRCFIAGVEKLEPGHLLTYSRDDGVRIRCYWDLAQAYRDKRTYSRIEDAEEELRARLRDSVALRMVSDVPLGAFLSGGIDSASIVQAMCAKRGDHPIMTFSIGFPERTYSELPEAREAATHLGTDHREKLAQWDLVKLLPKIVYSADEPFADNSIIPTFFLSEFARANVTVSLSGDGGDEVLGGYETYLADKLHAGLHALPRPLVRGLSSVISRAVTNWVPATFNKVGTDDKLRRFVAGMELPAAQAHYLWRIIFGESEKATLLRPEAYAATSGESGLDYFGGHFDAVEGCHYLDRSMYVDIKTWLAHDILHKVDRASMAHSLEVRTPFLDHTLVEFCASLPVAFKIHGRTTKRLLRRSQRAALPRSITAGRKRGFNAPMAHWLPNELRQLAMDVLFGAALGRYVQREAVEALWQAHEQGRADNSYRLFGLLCLGLWLEQPVSKLQ